MEYKGKILIVDDDETFRTITRIPLAQKGYYVQTADNALLGLEKLKETSFDILMTDLKMQPMDGFELMKQVQITFSDIIVIVITAYATIETAIEAIKLGAYDYIPKPCSNDEILIKVERALEKKKTDLELRLLKENLTEQYQFHNIISKNRQMQKIFQHIKQIADTDTTVMIYGETGTGKELIARAIHFNSPRRKNTLIAVNCGALSETLLESELFGHERGAFTGAFKQKQGRFELAHGGTLFLDEVGDIPLPTQVKLLRAIEEKAFMRVGGTETIRTNVRIIGATNKNLEDLIKKGSFREDLYYRLNVFPIKLPPLRERKEDMPLLVTHFIRSYSEKAGKEINDISPQALTALLEYDWPGNIRELENVIERSILLESSGILNTLILPTMELKKVPVESGISHLSKGALSYKEYIKNILASAERDYIVRILKKHSGNIQLASHEAKINRKTIYRKMTEYGLKKSDFKQKE